MVKNVFQGFDKELALRDKHKNSKIEFK